MGGHRGEFSDARIRSLAELPPLIARWNTEAAAVATAAAAATTAARAAANAADVERRLAAEADADAAAAPSDAPVAPLLAPRGVEPQAQGEAPAPEAPRTTKFCFECGATIVRAAKFCSSCGTKQP